MTDLPEQLQTVRAGRVWVRPELKPILTKADLREHFQLRDNRALLTRVVTPAVLFAIGMDVDTYKSRSAFTQAESSLIYQALGIAWLRTSIKSKP